MSNPIHIAIASPLGGVGKTTLTILAASTLHYHLGYSVAVIDCNYPLYTTAYLRGKETEGQNKQGFSDKCLKNMMRQPLWLQPYPIVCVPIAKAWKETERLQAEIHPKCIFFDLPSLMRTEGTVELLTRMDAVIFPVTGNPMDADAVRRFIEIVGEQILTMGKGSIKELCLLRNMVGSWEKEEVQERCRTLADETGAVLMQTSLPYSKHFRPSFADGKAGICTLHYPRSGTLGRLADSLGKNFTKSSPAYVPSSFYRIRALSPMAASILWVRTKKENGKAKSPKGRSHRRGFRG